MCIGLLPVGLAGMRPGRRGRIVAVSAGVLFAAFLLVGSAISQLAWLAVIGMFTIPVLASSAVRPTLRRLALALLVPAVAVGLSFGEIDDALSLAWAIVIGALWMTVISLLWPERRPEAPVPVPAMTAGQARTWGLMLGGAAGTATLVGELASFSHVGWAPTAALLVMRPQRDLLTMRGTGRVIATFTGAVAAAGGVALAPRATLLACAVGLVLVATIATRTSRWYVASAGTSYLVLTMLLYGAPGAAVQSTFWGRVGAAFVGVGLAYVFGVLVPKALAARSRTER